MTAKRKMMFDLKKTDKLDFCYVVTKSMLL